ncbi:hypothetical protein JTB14_007128 [Gonioctena quinquepunctata]|nr:hypothetical protein JTB14_007128 [Gonioctena quinquepunctata]
MVINWVDDKADDRVNQNPQHTLFQVIFLREHNKIAKQLAIVSPQWNDEKIYQETRKIVIAEYTHIAYYEWLPLLLGENILYDKNIIYKRVGQVRDYDERVSPAVLNEHATAAFRYFHSLITGKLNLVSESREVYKTVRLSDWYFRPQVLEDDDNFDGFTRGLNTQPPKSSDRFLDKEVTNFLFRSGELGLDLKATDIHRSRDHGLASYNDMREFCGFRKATSFEDFLDLIPKQIVAMLRYFYEHPDDVDLIIGGSLESNIPGTLVGPTFRCILINQFHRTRVADRFWFENDQFTSEQLREIRKSSISRLLCDNGKHIEFMQKRGFRQISNT